ncbi:MAG: hypothetical protein AB8H79_25765 [Myxococcota bacterium]
MKPLVCAALAGCSGAMTPTAPSVEHVPQSQAQALSDGGRQFRIDSAELARVMTAPSARPRVYNVWATWCGPCIAEMPALEAFAEAHPSVELWYVNTDHPGAAEAKVDRVIQDQGLADRSHLRPAETATDLTASIPDFPNVLPVTLVVSPSGARNQLFVGAVDSELLARTLRRSDRATP